LSGLKAEGRAASVGGLFHTFLAKPIFTLADESSDPVLDGLQMGMETELVEDFKETAPAV
jgi:hypothetical protein